MSLKKIALVLAIGMAVAVISCKKENTPSNDNSNNNNNNNNNNPPPGCDTANMSYSKNISGIMQKYNCTGCHAGGFQDYTTHAKFKAWLDVSGNKEKIFKAINHEAGVQAMPQSAPKMDSCDIQKVEAWINQGYLNN